MNLLNALQKSNKCLPSLAINDFSPTCFINSIKHEHSCKILFVFYKYNFQLNFIFQIDLKSKEFHDFLANLNSCFEDDNLRILEDKLIGSKKLTENEDNIVTGLGKHMIQKLAGKVQVSSSRFDKACPCGTIEPKGVCPVKAPFSKGPMYIGRQRSI